MRIPAFSLGLLACIVSQVAATALTYKQYDDEDVAIK